jgi:DNA-binding transcriptional regulator LsrR (DeoR family)
VLPLLAALKAGVITHLVLDEQTATGLVALIDTGDRTFN